MPTEINKNTENIITFINDLNGKMNWTVFWLLEILLFEIILI